MAGNAGRIIPGIGGGGTKIEQPAPPAPPPAPPTPGETAEQSIQAQIDAVPKILASQQEFAPQFSQLELENFQRFGPQFTEAGLDLAEQFGGRLNELTRAEQEVLAPERVAGSDAIAQFLNEGPEDLTDTERDQFLQDVRAAQQTRGLGQSGMAAVDELKKITGLRQSLKDRYLNVALSASGRLPSAGGSSVAAPNTSMQQLVKNVDPATFFAGQASNNQLAGSIFNTQGGIFGSQASMYNSQLSNQSSPLGAIVGGAVGAFTGGLGAGVGTAIGSGFGQGNKSGCWVAKEIFGSWEDQRTVLARHYINSIGPRWFKDFYWEYGEKFAEYISDKPIIKAILTPLFLWFGNQSIKKLASQGGA